MDLYKPCSTMTVKLIDYIQNNPETIYHMDQFLEKYQNAIFNFVSLTIGDYHNGMDVTNRILLTLSRKVKEVREKKAFNALAMKVIRGEIGNYWKTQNSNKMKMLKKATIIHESKEISLYDTLASNEAKAGEIFDLLVIRDMLENLPNKNVREVFLRKYRDGESIDAISKQLALSQYQVKKYLQDVQSIVKQYLEEG